MQQFFQEALKKTGAEYLSSSCCSVESAYLWLLPWECCQLAWVIPPSHHPQAHTPHPVTTWFHCDHRIFLWVDDLHSVSFEADVFNMNASLGKGNDVNSLDQECKMSIDCKVCLTSSKVKILKKYVSLKWWHVLTKCDGYYILHIDYLIWRHWYSLSPLIWNLPFNNSVGWARNTQPTHPVRLESFSSWTLKAPWITVCPNSWRSHKGCHQQDGSGDVQSFCQDNCGSCSSGRGRALVFHWKNKKPLRKKSWGFLSAMRGQNGHGLCVEGGWLCCWYVIWSWFFLGLGLLEKVNPFIQNVILGSPMVGRITKKCAIWDFQV